jgi:hypothetical protein
MLNGARLQIDDWLKGYVKLVCEDSPSECANAGDRVAKRGAKCFVSFLKWMTTLRPLDESADRANHRQRCIFFIDRADRAIRGIAEASDSVQYIVKAAAITADVDQVWQALRHGVLCRLSEGLGGSRDRA